MVHITEDPNQIKKKVLARQHLNILSKMMLGITYTINKILHRGQGMDYSHSLWDWLTVINIMIRNVSYTLLS